jgi:hypothetical protein
MPYGRHNKLRWLKLLNFQIFSAQKGQLMAASSSADGYEACKEYLRDYRGRIVFQSLDDLAERLKQRLTIESPKELAKEDSQKYVGEQHRTALLKFISAEAG